MNALEKRDHKNRLARERYARNSDQRKANAAAYYEKNREKVARRRKTPASKAIHAAEMKHRYHALRQEVLAQYGRKCDCCGEHREVFLELSDDPRSDNRPPRDRKNRGAMKRYVWAKNNGWPKDGLRLLCANCNQGRGRNAGICPHEVERISR